MARRSYAKHLALLPHTDTKASRHFNQKAPVAVVVQVDPQVLENILAELCQIKGKLQNQPIAKTKGLDAREAAKLLKVSDALIYELAKKNEIPHFFVGRLLRIPENVVEQMVRLQQEEQQHV